MFTNLKICGLSAPDVAHHCAERGVGAVGVVFYPPSPRHVTARRAAAVLGGLPGRVARVGVFVDATPAEIIATARVTGLTTAQLHGHEPNSAIRALQEAGLRVIKVLRETGQNLVESYLRLPPDTGVLVECGTGALPGGNAAVWDWAAAAPLARHTRFAVAGGLDPATIATAMRDSGASAWDVSSGVESAPGVKDLTLIDQLLDAMRRAASTANGTCDGLPNFWGAAQAPL